MRRQPLDRFCQTGFGAMQGGQVQPRFTVDRLADDRAVLQCLFDRPLDDLLRDLDQVHGPFDRARLRIADMPFVAQFPQRIADGRPRTMRRIAVDPQLGSQLVRRLESDPANVVRQLVRIGLDPLNGFLSVGSVDPQGPAGADAVLAEEQHDLADFALFVPAAANSFQPFLSDAADMQQEVWAGVENLQRPFLVNAHDFGRQLRTDAADGAGRQVPLDPLGRRRRRGADIVGLELLAVLAIHRPNPGRGQVLAGGHRGHGAHDGDQIAAALDLDLEHRKPVLRVVVRDAFDQADELFGHSSGIPTERGDRYPAAYSWDHAPDPSSAAFNRVSAA